MLPKEFEQLPQPLRQEAVRPYFDSLNQKRATLLWKRFFDLFISFFVLLLLSPILLVAACMVKFTSKGPVFYKQVRVGALGREFRILKFRTMVVNADKIGAQITVGENDPRITKVGKVLRVTRVDEFPQLINVLKGDMSLVGTRPEVPRYVREYEPAMYATLLLPPGITGEASIQFRHENEMLASAEEDPEEFYIRTVLPQKMQYNLHYLEQLSIGRDLSLLLRTVGCVFQR